FQAEDGIRDKLVTGVQTCALPISKASRDAGGDLVADEAAEIRRAGGQRLGERARHTLVQVLNEGRIAEALGSGKRRLSSERPKKIGRASCRERVEITGVGSAIET